VSSIVPIFRDSGFDAEATRALGKAYDIACRSLHPNGQPPVVQEILAKKIIEVAQRGERNPDRLAAIALADLGPFHREVTRRFGLIPRFFMSAPDAPEIVEKLWDFAKSAYLDSPIPSLFKERLFVFLSRFCQVRSRNPATARRLTKLIRARLETMGPDLWKLIRDGSGKVATHAILATAVKHSPLLGDFLDIVVGDQ
jgi:BrxA